MGGYEGIWARKTISIGRNFGIVLGFEWRSEQHQRTNWIARLSRMDTTLTLTLFLMHDSVRYDSLFAYRFGFDAFTSIASLFYRVADHTRSSLLSSALTEFNSRLRLGHDYSFP